MDDYLTKPIHAPDLAAVLTRWVTVPIPIPIHAPAGVSSISDASTERSILERLDELRDDTGADLVARLAASFLTRAPGYLGELTDCLERDDPDALIRAAHSLNGVAGNLGAIVMSTLCLSLEEAGREGRPQSAPDLLNSLTLEYDVVRQVLEAVLAD
jgi:HPt (histidine-containing phosphotransfer) domain-containing protein